MRKVITRKNTFITLFFVLLFILYLLPVVLLQENAYIFIHDNLDGEFSWRVALARYGMLFDYDANIEAIMNGLPRSVLPGGANFTWSLFYFFKPLTAYSINYVAIHAVAFAGMYMLLKKHFVCEEHLHVVAVGVAFCFAILPFHPMFGLTVAGLPLVLFAFINLYFKKHLVISYALLLFFGLYSAFVLTGVLVVGILLMVWLLLLLKTKQWHIHLLLGGILLLLTYSVVERHFIYTFFLDDTFISHRSERNSWATSLSITFAQAATLTSTNLIKGHYHAHSLQNWIALLVVPFTVILGLITKSERGQRTGLLLSFLGISLLVSLTYGFENWALLLPVKEKIPFLFTFHIRLFWTAALWWYVIFALCLALIGEHQVVFKKIPSQILIAIFILGQVMFVLSYNQEVVLPIKAAFGTLEEEDMTYAQFYSENLFSEINAFIGRPQEGYRVINLGIHPAIALHNGFYTLDGYQNNYPLSYKQAFRRIMADELAKTLIWQEYFDGWGNRAYLFTPELFDFMYTKHDNGVVEDIVLETAVLREMGADYVFSGVEIKNAEQLGLAHVQTFENETSPWRIFLYEVINAN